MLRDIYLKSYNEHYTHIWDDQGKAYLKNFYQPSTFEKGLNNPDHYYYLIYLSHEPIGLFKVTEKELEGYHPEQCLEINKLYILNQATGKGIGSKVLAYIINLAVSMKRSIIWLNVMAKSEAKGFYEYNGFELVKQVSLDYPHMKPGLNVLATYKKELTKF